MRTTNPIESTFATVRLRTETTNGSDNRAVCLTRVFKLMECNAGNADWTWRSEPAAWGRRDFFSHNDRQCGRRSTNRWHDTRS